MSTVTLPNQTADLTAIRDRWAEIVVNPYWHTFEGRVESDALGQVIVMPPPGSPHCRRQSRIFRLLDRLLEGEPVTEAPILTIDGVKGLDLGWFSTQRYHQTLDQDPFEIAPEICIEVVSPSNTPAEMNHKRHLYFTAGALEVWECQRDGSMTFYHHTAADTPAATSSICPPFPPRIDA